MTSFEKADLRGASFTDVTLREARFRSVDLSGAVLREVDVDGTDIDAPWLAHAERFVVNGVDVRPLVEAELDRRLPGRAQRQASDPDGLRAAWAALEAQWQAAYDRAAALPPGGVDVSVDGEWSFAQTLRHLVLATDLWFRKSVLAAEAPFHPLGLTNAEAADEGFDMSVFTSEAPTYDEVLAARVDRVGQVRDFLATVTDEELGVPRTNPWAPEHPETTLSCLHTVLEEEWEHLRYALRDLDSVEQGRA